MIGVSLEEKRNQNLNENSLKGNSKMEKITKEELMEKLLNKQMSNDELELIAGGSIIDDCLKDCYKLPPNVPSYVLRACVQSCVERYAG